MQRGVALLQFALLAGQLGQVENVGVVLVRVQFAQLGARLVQAALGAQQRYPEQRLRGQFVAGLRQQLQGLALLACLDQVPEQVAQGDAAVMRVELAEQLQGSVLAAFVQPADAQAALDELPGIALQLAGQCAGQLRADQLQVGDAVDLLGFVQGDARRTALDVQV